MLTGFLLFMCILYSVNNQYDAIYLSPHLDDAALSCGGQIYQQTQAGNRVLIVTITAGAAPTTNLSAFAQGQHDSWELDVDPVEVRRREDIESSRRLSSEWLHWDVMDCIYRRHPETGAALYTSDETLFGVLNSAESPLIQHLTQKLLDLPASTTIYCPLGLGNHVDHQLVRVSAETAFAHRLTYYEDYPYAQREGFTGLGSAWQSHTVALSNAAIDARIHAVNAFESQVDHLFGSSAQMADNICAYIAQVGGERTWTQQK